MAQKTVIRPTLLVGVGGTGSKIAEAVYMRARKNSMDHARLRVLAFDTDENDTQKLVGLSRDRQAIRFSSSYTIDEILDKDPRIEQNWFVTPRDSLPMELRKMTLLDGAGQVRMLSRLAMHDAASQGQMEQYIGSAVSDLIKYDNQSEPINQINVQIIGSLAGATGSGIFLQAASLINDIAKKRNVQTQVRGLFLMPDVYVRTGVIPDGQISNVLANGYASLKEFHAMTLKSTQRAGALEFEFEYAPDQFLYEGDIPFASLSLIDYEDLGGGNMGRDVNGYVKMAEQASYTMLFTPIGGRTDSITVNDILQTAAAAGRDTHNRVAAIGISSISYPKEEIFEYLRDRIASEVLAGDWLRLDRQYLMRIKRFKEERRSGNMSAVEPDQGNSYLSDLKQFAVDDQIPFFREIYDKLNLVVIDSDGSETDIKTHEAYLEAFTDQILKIYWSSDELSEVHKRANADDGQFSSQKSLVEEIRRRENRLEDDYRRVEKSLSITPIDIMTNLMVSSDQMGENEWKDYHLQSYLIQGGSHPVQSRAFLFSLRKHIEDKLKTLDSSKAKKQYFSLANKFRDDGEDKKSPDTRSTPNILKLANQLAKKNPLTRLLSGGPKRLVEDYVGFYNSSIRKLRDYGNIVVQERIYDRLLQEINEHIRVLNSLFNEVETAMATLETGIRENEELHDGTSLFGSTLFVGANADCKRAFWEKTSELLVGQSLDVDINKSIMQTTYKMARDRRTNNEAAGLNKLRDEFKAAVIDRFAAKRLREDFASVYDKSVIEAMKFEAEVLQQDPAVLLEDKIKIVRRQSETMISLNDPRAGQRIQFWAMNDDLRRQIDNIQDTETLINPSGQGVQLVESEEFDSQEIMAVSYRVNLELSHLAKLNPPILKEGSIATNKSGRYFDEYQNRVDKLIDAAAKQVTPDTLTPHLHKDWHKPGLLPEISSAVTEKFIADMNKAFAISSTYELLRLEIRHSKRIAEFNTVGRVRSGGVAVDLIENHDFYDVLGAFAQHPEAIRGSLGFWDEELNNAASEADPDGYIARIGRSGVVEQILMISEQRRDWERRDIKVSNLIAGHCQMLLDLLIILHPNLPIKVVSSKAEELVANIGREAIERLRENASPESIKIMSNRHAFGVENWRNNQGTLSGVK